MADPAAQWFVYILRCADGLLYTGITTDMTRRLTEHNGQSPGGARFTRGRRPVEVAYIETAADRSSASKREAMLKKLDRDQKIELCNRAVNTAMLR